MLKYLLVITVSLSFAAADGMRWKRVVKAGERIRGGNPKVLKFESLFDFHKNCKNM